MRRAVAVTVLFATLALALSSCGGPRTAKEHVDASMDLQQQARFEEALNHYDEAIRLDPEYVDAYVNRCATYNLLGLYQQAIEDCDVAIRLDSEYAAAYNNRGFAYADQGQSQRAIQDFDEAIRLDPQDISAYVNRAVAYTLLGRDEEASKDVERIGELQKDPIALRAYLEVLKEQR